MKRQPIDLHLTAAVRDATGVRARPGLVAVARGRVVWAGHPDHLPSRLRKQSRVVEHPTTLLMPAFVNAHAHLDLTSLGPRACPDTFTDWIRGVIRDRPTETLDVVASVRQGLRRARDAGVGYLGDIAGSAQAVHARRTVPQELLLPGVSYLECFGIGEGEAEAARQIKTRLGELPFETPIPGHDRGIVLGIAPHAPYSTGLAVYDAAARLSQDRAYRVSTHLAEAPEEIAFVRDAAGPLADLLRELGKWDASIEPTGKHPVDHLEPALRRARWLVVHANYLEDSHLPLLRKAGASVVYCPVASDYFGHTGHRYRELLDAGVNVCLGTDSILCQPADPPDGQPLGILGQMRHLYRRDGADPELLLKMATTNGLLALEFDQRDASLHEGAPARFATVEIDPESRTDPLEQILTGNQPAAGLDLTGAERDQE